MTAIQANTLRNQEILNKIAIGSKAWRHVIPTIEQPPFVRRVQKAVEIYLGLVSPHDLGVELRNFEKATRTSSKLATQLFEELSDEAKTALYEPNQLSTPLSDYPATQNLSDETRSHLISGQSWQPEAGGKRRRHTHIVGPHISKGRPSHAKIDVLVSLISAAYAAATNKKPSRSWSEAVESDIEMIVEDCLANMGIDDVFSAKAGVRRHMKGKKDFYA